MFFVFRGPFLLLPLDMKCAWCPVDGVNSFRGFGSVMLGLLTCQVRLRYISLFPTRSWWRKNHSRPILRILYLFQAIVNPFVVAFLKHLILKVLKMVLLNQ